MDVISLSAYYPLSDQTQYSVRDLIAGWRSTPRTPRTWFAEVKALNRRFRRPVMFGEIGYRPVAGSAQRPWDIALQGPRSPLAQSRAYEAAFRVWYRVGWFRGFHWWYVHPKDRPNLSARGADHAPLSRALKVLARYHRSRRR